MRAAGLRGSRWPVSGVPLVPVGQPVRPLVTELVAAQFDTVAAAAEGCDALVARPA